ncbi:MAG: DUF4097 family beta strand repeat protein [Ignavibacteriales bacterium]|nr:DUF4097 family beta strand repeat protein [Ignavibacteriales bacterium]
MRINWRTGLVVKAAVIVAAAATLGTAQNKLLLEKTFAEGSIMRVEVDAEACDVDVSQGGSGIVVKIYGDDDADKYLEFSAEQDGSTLEVGAEKRGGFNSLSDVDARIEIAVPASAIDLSVKTAGGDVSCSDVNGGAINLKTAGGDVSVTEGGGELSAKTAGGDISVTDYDGPVELKTAGGDVSVVGVKGAVNAKTAGGDVRVESENGDVDAETAGGDLDVVYSGDVESITLGTSAGDIRLSIDEDAKADLEITTNIGDISVSHPGANVTKSKDGKLEAEINGGGGSIEINASVGDVSVVAN